MALEPGFHAGIPADQYHADPAISRSQLSLIVAGDPLSVVRHAIESDDDSETDALAFGRMAHAYILEDAPVVSIPDATDLRTKAGRELRAQVEADNPGAAVVRAGVLRSLDAMRDSLQNHAVVGRWMDVCTLFTEPSIVWDAGGVRCKARPDAVGPTGSGAFDLKFVRSVRERDIRNAIRNYGWDIQVVHYEAAGIAAGKFQRYPLVFVDKNPPHEVRVVDLSEERRQWAEIRWSEALSRVAAAQAMDEWPGYPHDEVVVVDAEPWMLRELEMHLGEVA